MAPVYLILSEASLLAALWAIWRGRALSLIEVQPIWGRSRPWLERIAATWERRGWLSEAGNDSPALRRILRNEHFHDMTDLFLRVEPWVESHFGFAAAERRSPSYHHPYMHTCWGEVYDSGRLAHIIELIDREAGGGARFIGASSTARQLAEVYGGRPLVKVPSWVWTRPLGNAAMALVVLMYILKWIAGRIVGTLPEGQKFLLGSTYARDHRLIHNLEDMADTREQVCIMFHDETLQASANREFDLTGFAQCLFGDGRFLPYQALQALGEAARDLLLLLMTFPWLRPITFLKLSRMVWYRVAYRALFRRHDFRNFWGRDEINADHMIRSQELRRIGGRSMGIAHGIPSSQILSPLRRVQDYDVYYFFGEHIYEKYYVKRWPKHMKVVGLGAFGMSHAQMKSIRVERNRDIMVFASNTLDDEAIVRETIRLAELLPDRKVLFKCKRGCLDAYQAFIDGQPPAPPNVEFVEPDSTVTYEFLRTGGYAVASHSTLSAEAIYFGTPTFVHDNQPPDMPFYYREFDRLCFTDATDVAGRIRAMEAGEETFPWHAYDGLIRLDNRFPMSIVRAEMGLPPKPDEDICLPLARIRGDAA